MKRNHRIKENAYKIKENDDNKAEMIFQDVMERTARICWEKLLSNEKVSWRFNVFFKTSTRVDYLQEKVRYGTMYRNMKKTRRLTVTSSQLQGS